jgi:hypothetical protein
MHLIGIFDHQLVEPELGFDRAEQGYVGLVQTEPHDPVVTPRKSADFLDRDIAYPLAVAV